MNRRGPNPSHRAVGEGKRQRALVRSRRTPLSLHGLMRAVPGGVLTSIEILRYSAVESVVQFVAAYDQLTRVAQRRTQIDTFARHLGVDIGTIVGEFSRLAYERGADIAKILQGIGMATMMGASVDTASIVGPEGFRERQMHFQQAGLAPQRQAPSVKQGVQVNIGRGGRLRPTSTEVTGLPPIILDQRALSERVRSTQDALVEAAPRMNEVDEDEADGPNDGSDE